MKSERPIKRSSNLVFLQNSASGNLEVYEYLAENSNEYVASRGQLRSEGKASIESDDSSKSVLFRKDFKPVMYAE